MNLQVFDSWNVSETEYVGPSQELLRMVHDVTIHDTATYRVRPVFLS